MIVVTALYVFFLQTARDGEFTRSVVPGAISTVGWFMVALAWFAQTVGGTLIYAVSFFFVGLGFVSFAQTLQVYLCSVTEVLREVE